jgi:hypothetical protein
MARSIEERFWEKVAHAETCQSHMDTPCWEWQGCKNNDGYGRFRADGRLVRAHAMAMFLDSGHMPKYVMHICDNPCCVRPSHLQEGTHGLNMKDAYKKQRRKSYVPKGVNQYKARFNEDDIRLIRRRYAEGETQKAIGASYGVHQAHISQIVRRRTYVEVQDL